jgi:membrane-bound metal-dependent hydrolase YbcI (DUF457 family)
MANYRTHFSFGIGSGAVVAAIGLAFVKELQFDILFLGAFAGYLGGLVPDLDHDNSVALSDIYSQMTTVIPAALTTVFLSKGGGWEVSILLLLLPLHYLLSRLTEKLFFPSGKVQRFSFRARAQAVTIAAISGLAIVLLVRTKIHFLQAWAIFLVIAVLIQVSQPLFQRMTVHRGIFHSIPAILIFTELVYLYMFRLPFDQRLVVTAAGFAGIFSHLLLDEIYSVDLENKRLKRSFGTALAFWKKRTPWLSGASYAISGVLLVLCFLR